MLKKDQLDATDIRILRELEATPRASAVAIAERTGLSRSTVQNRLARLDGDLLKGSFTRVDPATLGYPLRAYVFAQVAQVHLNRLPETLGAIPEILEIIGISGDWDLLIHVVAEDAEDLYRVADLILANPDIQRTTTALVMRDMLPYRVDQLMDLRTERNRRSARP